MGAIGKAGYKAGSDVMLALDCAATEFFKDGNYVYGGENKIRSRSEQAKYLADLASRYPIVSIEDGMSEDDMEGWKELTDLIGNLHVDFSYGTLPGMNENFLPPSLGVVSGSVEGDVVH